MPSPPRPPDRPAAVPPIDPRLGVVVERRGLPRPTLGARAGDFYHALLGASWARTIATLAAVFVLANLLFAALLYFGGAEILNARSGSFLDRFWFSVQTMATIGYGYMAPVDHFAGVVTAIESFFGILLLATTTGVFFAKFSRPTARVRFSAPVVIGHHDGARVLSFRMANARTTAVVEATISVTLMRDEVLASGEQVRRLYDLRLRRSTSPSFALTWTAYHEIDEDSPLALETPDTLARGSANILVTFIGIDDRLAATVHARQAYRAADVRWDHQFVDVIGHDPHSGRRYLDFARFDDTAPIADRGPGPA